MIYKGKLLTYKFRVLAVKGDWPFLRSSCGLNNGYNCMKKCHRCQLDEPLLNNQFLVQSFRASVWGVPKLLGAKPRLGGMSKGRSSAFSRLMSTKSHSSPMTTLLSEA